jgi:hypothetical protein
MYLTQYLDEHKVKYQVCAHRPTFTAQHMGADADFDSITPPAAIQFRLLGRLERHSLTFDTVGRGINQPFPPT